MKIGILTFHGPYNYGAVLQAFALQEFLKSCGHEVEIIDYIPNHRKNLLVPPMGRIVRRLFRKANQSSEISVSSAVHRKLPERKISRITRYVKNFIPRTLWSIAHKRALEGFISKKLNLSPERFHKGGTPPQRYDAIVFGSDQIWNPYLTGGVGDPVFLGDFTMPEKTLKIAYAASAGGASGVVAKIPAFVNALKDFDAISVREQNLADALKQNLENEIKVALDPTLLVEKAVWDKIAVSPRTKREYVLVYQMLHTPAANRIARELAEQIGADVISVGSSYWNRQQNDLSGNTPERFVGWFKNAAFVVTTSFHGTAFSIIYGKPFYYVSKGAPGENRPRHILQELGLLDRIVGEDAHPKFSEIDYSNSKARLETLRSASREFLETALAGKTSVVDSGVFNPSESEAK